MVKCRFAEFRCNHSSTNDAPYSGRSREAVKAENMESLQMKNEQSGHSTRVTNAKLKELCYILVLHPQYSPDLFLGDNFISLKLTQISYKRGGQDRKKRLFEASHYEPVSKC